MAKEINYYNGKTKKWIREPKAKDGCKYTAYDTPDDDEIKYFIETEWKSEVISESAINMLFNRLLPDNTAKEQVFAKIGLLNDVYSTNLSNKQKTRIAEIISSEHEFDRIVKAENTNAEYFNDLCLRIKKDPDVNEAPYSFLSKYFSHHNPNYYPIFDGYVEIMLKWYRDHSNCGFCFSNEALSRREYGEFASVIKDFKTKFNLKSSIKEIDQFLWTAGKIFFFKYE